MKIEVRIATLHHIVEQGSLTLFIHQLFNHKDVANSSITFAHLVVTDNY